MNNYCLPDNYQINDSPSHEVVYNKKAQQEVYQFAKNIMKKKNYSKIVDIGCGQGWKLIHYLGKYDTVGFECEPAISLLRKNYPDRVWIESGEQEKSFNNDQIFKTDIIMTVDVIEHILNPDDLMNYINKFDYKYLIISTPCREIMTSHPRFVTGRSKKYRRNHIGPSPNPCHVREWTSEEFKLYLSKFVDVKESFLGKKQVECQWHLCTKKNI